MFKSKPCPLTVQQGDPSLHLSAAGTFAQLISIPCTERSRCCEREAAALQTCRTLKCNSELAESWLKVQHVRHEVQLCLFRNGEKKSSLDRCWHCSEEGCRGLMEFPLNALQNRQYIFQNILWWLKLIQVKFYMKKKLFLCLKQCAKRGIFIKFLIKSDDSLHIFSSKMSPFLPGLTQQKQT